MQPSLEYYLDRAKRLHGWHSDAQLAKALDVARATVHAWRNYDKRPAEKQINAIATLSGLSPQLVLLDLQAWKHEGTSLGQSYSLIRDVFRNQVAAWSQRGHGEYWVKHSLDYYIDRAMKLHGFAYYSELARALNIGTTALTFWRQGKCLPNQDHMARLAQLGDLSLREALIDLQIWESKDKPLLNAAYQSIQRTLDGH